MQQTQAEMMSSGRHPGIPASSVCMPRKPGWETVVRGLERGHTEGRQHMGALNSGVLSVLTFDQTWDPESWSPFSYKGHLLPVRIAKGLGI